MPVLVGSFRGFRQVNQYSATGRPVLSRLNLVGTDKPYREVYQLAVESHSDAYEPANVLTTYNHSFTYHGPVDIMTSKHLSRFQHGLDNDTVYIYDGLPRKPPGFPASQLHSISCYF